MDRTVHIVNFNVARSLRGLSEYEERVPWRTMNRHNNQKNINIVAKHGVSLATMFMRFWAQERESWILTGVGRECTFPCPYRHQGIL